MIWTLLAGIVAALITAIGGNGRNARRFIENWSPATRYRELRLLRSHESKAEEMNSTSCDLTKNALRSFVRDCDCEIERFEFARELKNPRKNLKLAEESSGLPSALIIEFVLTWTFLMLFIEGTLVLPGLLGQWLFIYLLIVVLAWFCLLTVVWALLTQAIKQYCWNQAIKYRFNDFLIPFFQESEACCEAQDGFKNAIRSFHNVYDDRRIQSLKKAFRWSLGLGSVLLFLATFADIKLQNFFHWDCSPWFHPTSLVVTVLMVVVLFCCLLAYNLKLEELIQEEKEKYPWYNPLIDVNHVQHNKILDKLSEFGYWLGEITEKSKKREEQNE